MRISVGEIDAPGRRGHGEPAKLGAERVHIELSRNAFTSEGRHFILEGGNVLALAATTAPRWR